IDMAFTLPFVVRGQVTAVGAEPGLNDPDPEPRQTGDLLVVRDPANAQMTLMAVAFFRMVISSRANRIILQTRMETTIGPGPAGFRGPLLPGFHVRERQAGDGLVAKLQGALLVELAQGAEMFRCFLQRLQALEA